MKILLWDTELSYAIGYFFPSKKPQYVSARQIKNNQSVVTASWKWLGQKKIYDVSTLDDPKRFKKNHWDDYYVAKTLHKVLSEADITVAHNNDQFDIRHANTIFSLHGLGPVPESKSIDTLKIARKYFNFAGNSLGDLLARYGYAGKEEKPDWIKFTEGDPKEIRKAIKYNRGDVIGLENIFHEFLPFIQNHPAIKASKRQPCKCGSRHLQSRGSGFDGENLYRRFKCMECGEELKR